MFLNPFLSANCLALSDCIHFGDFMKKEKNKKEIKENKNDEKENKTNLKHKRHKLGTKKRTKQTVTRLRIVK